MKTEIRYAVYVVHPVTKGLCWFKEPGQGWSYSIYDAHLWHPDDLASHLERVQRENGDWGMKTGEYPARIRQVNTVLVTCPEREGRGDCQTDQQYGCPRCHGTGEIRVPVAWTEPSAAA